MQRKDNERQFIKILNDILKTQPKSWLTGLNFWVN